MGIGLRDYLFTSGVQEGGKAVKQGGGRAEDEGDANNSANILPGQSGDPFFLVFVNLIALAFVTPQT